MRLGLLAIAAIAALSDVASAENKPIDKSLDSIDFLVDGRDLIGKRVTVTDCKFRSASSTFVVCGAPNGTGSIYIDSDSLERESLRRALRTCAGYEESPQCRGSVTGIVSLQSGGPYLRDATIEWAQSPAALQEFGDSDLVNILNASRNNEPSFDRDYEGRIFAARRVFEKLTEPYYAVLFSPTGSGGIDVACFVHTSDPAVGSIIDWRQGQIADIKGTIGPALERTLLLTDCTIKRYPP